MKKAEKFVAECGGYYDNPSSMSDEELERAYHNGQHWEGNMVCGHWYGTSKASAAVKKEYEKRRKQREKERDEEYKHQQAEYEELKRKSIDKAKSKEVKIARGEGTTKQSFEQNIWVEEVSTLDQSINILKLGKEIAEKKLNRYQKTINKWKKIKGMDKKRIEYGQKIVDALKSRVESLEKVLPILESGKGVWWNVTIPIENGKKFYI